MIIHGMAQRQGSGLILCCRAKEQDPGSYTKGEPGAPRTRNRRDLACFLTAEVRHAGGCLRSVDRGEEDQRRSRISRKSGKRNSPRMLSVAKGMRFPSRLKPRK